MIHQFNTMNAWLKLIIGLAICTTLLACSKKDEPTPSPALVPTITSFTPTNARQGTAVTITGTNFTGTTAVSFGGTAAASSSVVSATSISAIVGTGTTGNVSVTTPNGTASLAGFIFDSANPISNPLYGLVSATSLGDKSTAAKTQKINFNLAWKKSWRDAINYDAVWLFVKFRTNSSTWRHATLNTNPALHSTGSQATAATIAPSADGKGVYYFRSSVGKGDFASNNVQLLWNYGTDGVADNDIVQLMVYSLEMVYVPQGSFYVGDGTDGTGDPGNIFQGQLRKAESNTPYQITSENAITLGGTAIGSLSSANGATPPDDFNAATQQTLPAAYPKGFKAFYAMKHEITQGQYADFLNSLNYGQQAGVTRQLVATPQYASVPPNAPVGTKAIITSAGNFRNYVEIKVSGVANSQPAVYGVDADEDNLFDETSDGGGIACGYLTWLDGCAYADWSGLRPMSQLEYEKACRGPLTPLANEFAWGNNTRIAATGLLNAGTENEVAVNSDANVCAANLIQGPVRVGMFSKSDNTRAQNGATYYGILDMSGNVWERVASIGRAQGRTFIGNHGDGQITINGNADVIGWTGLVGGEVTTGLGTGFLGGNFFRTEDFNGVYFNYALLRVSGRLYGNTEDTVRFSGNGFRCIRSAD